MAQPTTSVKEDFDRIALLAEQDGWSHNDHYHGYLLKQVPPRCVEALEIGCGTGTFSRGLAERADRVLALDLSPQMIRVARQHSGRYANIDFRVADALEWEFPVQRFDCIASIATLHHLPMETMLAKMRTALKANGTLVVLDLYQAKGLSDALTSLVAMPVNLALRLANSRRLTVPREVQEAWAEHGRHDKYLTLSEVRRICAKVLPGAKVRKHLLWRYSIVWKKGGAGLRTTHNKIDA
jgi:ubiquinone/menaquinone biosynthesis C-methylase UbiE